MIEELVSFFVGAVADVLAWLGWDKLSDRLKAKENADPRNWTPPR